MTLGQQIQALRKAAGLSQEELGEKLGVARQSVSKWESDATVPELEKLIAMSKLFGVSMGSLLGLEESGGAEGELTERELRALEEIARRTARPQGGTRRRGRLYGAILAAAALLVGAWLFGRVQRLEDQLSTLYNNVDGIRDTVSGQMGSLAGQIRAQVREALEEQDQVTAQKGYDVAGMDLKAGTVTFALSAIPREYREGMTAAFTAAGADFEAVEVPGELGAGQSFSARLTCPLADDISLTVAFTEDGVTVSKELGRERLLLANAELSLWGNLNWTASNRGQEKGMVLTRLSANVEPVATGWYHDGTDWRELTLAEAELRLWKNGQVVWSRVGDELTRGLAMEETAIPVRDLGTEVGDRLVLSVLGVDGTGREKEFWLDGCCVTRNGMIHLDPPGEGGDPAPWE